MKIPKCPKNLNHCSEQCPMYRCWALDEYEEKNERIKASNDSGWE